MNTHTAASSDAGHASRRPLHPLIWVAGIAVIIGSMTGVAAVMGWLPAASGTSAEALAQHPAAPSAAHASRPRAASSAPAPSVASTAPAARPAVLASRCAECGVVESVREVQTKGEGSGLGAVGGAVAGGVLGNQVGGGRGQDVMTVVGAIGGGLAGNEVEKRMKATTSWVTAVRMDDGSLRSTSVASAPVWRAGDKVRVVDGAIRTGS